MKRYCPQPIKRITDSCFVFDCLFGVYVSPSILAGRANVPADFPRGWGLSTSFSELEICPSLIRAKTQLYSFPHSASILETLPRDNFEHCYYIIQQQD